MRNTCIIGIERGKQPRWTRRNERRKEMGISKATGTTAQIQHGSYYGDVIAIENEYGQLVQLPFTEKSFATLRTGHGFRFVVLREDAAINHNEFGIAHLFFCWRDAFEHYCSDDNAALAGIYTPEDADGFQQLSAVMQEQMADPSTWWRGQYAECATIKDLREVTKEIAKTKSTEPANSEFSVWAAAAAVFKYTAKYVPISANTVEAMLQYYGGRAVDDSTFRLGIGFMGRDVLFSRLTDDAFMLTLA